MSVLIYAKLDPASGNATSAGRLAGFLETEGPVILRGLPPEDTGKLGTHDSNNETEAVALEVAALRSLATNRQIKLAIGIHCYRSGILLQQAFASSGESRVPYALIASGTDLNIDLQNKARNATLRAAMKQSAGIAALSPDMHDKAEEILTELPPDQRPPLALILQAPEVETDSSYSLRAALGLSATQKLILLPAGIRPVKGVAFAIEAMAQALIDYPEHVFAVLGPVFDTDYHAHCASLIGEWRLRHRGLKGRMHLLNGLPRSDYLAALREADLLLNTSESEAVSNAVLEALGAGVPVLAPDITGNRAVIRHEDNGLLFDRLPAFLREYRRLFSDTELSRRVVANGRKTYQAQCDPAREKRAYLEWVARACAFHR